ncbi:MAG: hypothetical protein AVDCRST_MAG40-877, partial [uncultured Gemmatimonadaceae bacterium]
GADAEEPDGRRRAGVGAGGAPGHLRVGGGARGGGGGALRRGVRRGDGGVAGDRLRRGRPCRGHRSPRARRDGGRRAPGAGLV